MAAAKSECVMGIITSSQKSVADRRRMRTDGDRDVADPSAMLFDERFTLHEHAGRAAAGIVDSPLVGFEHRKEE